MTTPSNLPSPKESVFANEPPFQGVLCEGAISRRMSRRNTFKLFSVEVTEEDSQDDCNENVNRVINFDPNISDELRVNDYSGEAGADANVYGQPSSNSTCFVANGRRASTMSLSSATVEGPIREIFVPDEDEIQFLQDMGQRRRSSDITAESHFELLIRQLEHHESRSQQETGGQPISEQVNENNSNLMKNPFRSFKGGFLRICNSIHENLRQEMLTNAIVPSPSASVGAADTPEVLANLSSRHAIDFDVRAESETLNSYFAQGRVQDVTAKLNTKLAQKRFNNNYYGTRTSNIAPKRHSNIVDDETILQSLESSFRQCAELKLARKCSSGLYDSTNTETTANSSVFDDFLNMGACDSFSSIDSSSLQSIALKGYV